mmetsp:Transcript_26688/g.22433  ORF Transcript_26688/g.22433 Transcript_26688/m.22433 type:complete len:109 (+) Transcript_26688:452-778(+)
MELEEFKTYLQNDKVAEQIFITLNSLTNYPVESDGKLTAAELSDIFQSRTILGRVFKLCAADLEKGLNKEEFHTFANHPSVQTYLFIKIDGAKGGMGNKVLSAEELKK